MKTKHLTIFFLCVLCSFWFFCTASALEVNYPQISGKELTDKSKLPDFAIYLFEAGTALGFLAVIGSLIAAGIMYLFSPVNAQMRASAKDRAFGAISGLLILVLSYLIITTINPQLSIFKLNELPKAPDPPPIKEAAGVYLYYNSNCPETPPNGTMDGIVAFNNISDLGKKNSVRSVAIKPDLESQTYYISILYDELNFRGQCQYINPNASCVPASIPANSASTYKYDFSPNGDGVYFFRKSYFDKSGGYLKIPNSRIGGNIYIESLDNLRFIDKDGRCSVPEENMDCAEYDKDNNCTKKVCPSLAGENISSINIKGKYLVLLVYFGPNDSPEGPWSSCQEFPAPEDANRSGPQQIKWDNIRNSSLTAGGFLPNFLIIIPIK